MKWEVVHVPGDLPPSDRGSTVNVFAANVEPRVCNTVVRQLGQTAPLQNLRHVKRVRKIIIDGKVQLTVILCQIHEQHNHIHDMPSDVVEMITTHKLNPFIVTVPQYAASTKEEWEEQCKLWPTSYHPPIELKDGACGFTEEDIKVICSFMEHAIMVAKAGSPDNQVVNAAIIVDPLVRQVVSSACDQTCSWPTLEHTDHCKTVSDNATDNSKMKLGISEPTGRSLWSVSVSCLDPWGWPQQQSCSSKSLEMISWHPLRHASLAAIELAAARDIRLFPCGKNGIGDVEVAANLTSKRQKLLEPCYDDECTRGDDHAALDINGTVGVTRPYLCTGFDAYLVWEPCYMCAMALLHQRVNRIFFAFSNPKAGALGGVHRLHGEKSLNHHYAVFKVLVPNNIFTAADLHLVQES